MQRVVVTGATSMIGCALIKQCVENGVEVLAIVREGTGRLNRLPESELIDICQCNLDKLYTIENRGQEYDVFYHFAWVHTSKVNRDDPLLQEMNIQYTLEAVKLAKKLGCYKFIGAGSQAEYGQVDHIITSSTKVSPCLSYGVAKYAAGKLSAKLCLQYDMVHIWGRIFSVYGCYDNEETMLVYAIDQFIKKETARFSAATQMWDYLYEDDAGKIFYLLGKYVKKDRVYCIASGNARPLKEYIIELKHAFGEGARCEFEKVGNLKKISIQADIHDLVHDIGYTPDTIFKEGVIKMIEYRKEIWRKNL